MFDWEEQIEAMIDAGMHQYSDIGPSDWAESKMVIKEGKFRGPLSYDLTPFFREPVNALSPYHGAQIIAWMGAAQMGKSKVLIEAGIAFRISEHPCSILYLTGHSELAEESMMKLDSAIDNADLRHLIFKQTLSKKNTQTGDTKQRKEFPEGNLIAGSVTNHNLLRQRDPEFVIVDDSDAAPRFNPKTGSTTALVRKRTNSYGNDKKILYVSSPQLKHASIIYEVYMEGDCRVYEIPCPCCGTMIDLKWENFTKELDDDNELVPGSVQYICQSCKNHFDETHKYEFNLAGQWRATKKAKDPNTISFWLPGWYAAPGMDSWEDIMREYLKACPPGQPVNKRLYQSWLNITAGLPYDEDFEEVVAGDLQKKNVNDYQPGTVPEKLSVKNGNGKIVLLTCAADMNGVMDNGRLDYEVKAWSENGSCYSVIHGSIGTFKPAVLRKKKDKDEAEITDWWSYEENKPLNIWSEFEKVLTATFPVDVCDGDKAYVASIGISVLDTGYFKNVAFNFIEKMIGKGIFIQGVKGKGDGIYNAFLDGAQRTEQDKKIITKGAEMLDNLWVLEVGYLKDTIAWKMKLNWKRDVESQPSGFMNFPHANNGLYEWAGFYEHYESEKPVIVGNKTETDITIQWKKKTTDAQNHFWDCCVYNDAAKIIWILVLREKYKRPDITWATYVDATLKMRNG